ncbi:MAG: class D sortase [Clostridia bacterium]
MIACHRRGVSLCCLIGTIILFSISYFLYTFCQKQITSEKPQTQTNIVLTMEAVSTQKKVHTIETGKVNIWKIQIPKIGLEAPILENTSNQTMKKAVGHFEDSSKWDGNVCLAAHNRGGNYHFFQDIEKLQKGDKIFYQTENGRRVYKVSSKQQIEENNWFYLQKTQQNQLTLITCVKNQSHKRWCIQAQQVNS